MKCIVRLGPRFSPSARGEAAGRARLSGRMDRISPLTIPVLGCVTSLQKPLPRIRKCIYSRSCVMLESAGHVAALCFLPPCCCPVALLWQQGGLGRSLRLTASTEKFLAEGSCLNVRYRENALSYAGIPPRPVKPLGFNFSALSLLKYSSVPGARGGLQVSVPWVLGVL